jgi:hypothetical protein
MILSLVKALFILSRGLLAGILLKGISILERFGIRKSVFPLKLDGVKFTV